MRRAGRHPRTLLFALMLPGVLASCRSDQTAGPNRASVSRVPKLTASDTTMQLQESDYNNTAVAFTWSPGSNHGTDAAIDYALQFDTAAAASFAAPISVPLGRAVYDSVFTVSQLESFVTDSLKIAPGTHGVVHVRLQSATSAAGVKPDYSNVVTLTITPYQPVSTTLYLIGSAAPNGWDASKATPLTPDPKLPFIFSWQGNLVPGQFKFITTLGQFLPSYNHGAADTLLFYRTDNAQPDSLFTVVDPGPYTMTVNLVAGTISVAKLPGPPYDSLWIVGDATPKGWNLDSAAMMRHDPNDPFIFEYNEVLNVGELKIATAKNWNAPFYRPTVNHPPLSDTTVQLSAGSPDNKWYIATAGAYKIRLNLRDSSIHIVPFTPYTTLWIVGDATPNGWNINSPNPMTPDPSNPYVFTYNGPLNVGEFKFPVATGDWGTDYFMPYTNHPALTDTLMQFVPGGQPDNKWQISTAGNYLITINQLYETISIQKQ